MKYRDADDPVIGGSSPLQPDEGEKLMTGPELLDAYVYSLADHDPDAASDETHRAYDALRSHLEQQASEIETLKADKSRLDFIERSGLAHAVGTGWAEDVVNVEVFDDEDEPSQEWSVIGGRCLDGIGTAIGQGATLRAAIDRAMSDSRREPSDSIPSSTR